VEDETKVTVSAIVTEDQIIETLTASGVEVKISGGLMIAQFMDMKQQMEDEANLVASLIKDAWPTNSPYDLEISYSNPVEKGDKYNIELEVTVKVNENYNILLKNLKGILDEIAFDYSDIPYTKMATRYQRIPESSRSQIQSDLFDSFVIFSNLSRESLYNKQLSESDYENNQSRYRVFYDNNKYTYGRHLNRSFSRSKGGYEFTDLFEKGNSPFVVGIMISDTELRIYRFLDGRSWDIINRYLKPYLYHVVFSITNLLSEMLEGMENPQIVHTFSLDLQPTFSEIQQSSLVEGQRVAEKYQNILNNKHPTLTRDWLIAKYHEKGWDLFRKTSIRNFSVWYGTKSADTIVKYFLPNYEEITTPQKFLPIPPAIGWRLALSVDTMPHLHKFWGTISLLPLIESNQTFATIENINLEITADVLSKLTSIIIAIK